MKTRKRKRMMALLLCLCTILTMLPFTTVTAMAGSSEVQPTLRADAGTPIQIEFLGHGEFGMWNGKPNPAPEESNPKPEDDDFSIMPDPMLDVSFQLLRNGVEIETENLTLLHRSPPLLDGEYTIQTNPGEYKLLNCIPSPSYFLGCRVDFTVKNGVITDVKDTAWNINGPSIPVGDDYLRVNVCGPGYKRFQNDGGLYCIWKENNPGSSGDNEVVLGISRKYTNLRMNSTIVPSTVTYDGTTYQVVGIEHYTFPETINQMTIPGSVKYIGERAFWGFSKLETVSLSEEGLETIRSGAFSECTSLSDINLPDSLKIIERQAFYGCTSLSTLRFPNELEVIGDGAFADCQNLSRLVFTNTKPPTIEGNPFKGIASEGTLYCPATATDAYKTAVLAALPPGWKLGGQSLFDLSGKVTIGGKPAAGAAIGLRYGYTLLDTTVTSADGEYQFQNLLPDDYTVEAPSSDLGGLTYYTTSLPVTLENLDVKNADIVLKSNTTPVKRPNIVADGEANKTESTRITLTYDTPIAWDIDILRTNPAKYFDLRTAQGVTIDTVLINEYLAGDQKSISFTVANMPPAEVACTLYITLPEGYTDMDAGNFPKLFWLHTSDAPNLPPVPKDPMPAIRVPLGGSVTFSAEDVAADPERGPMTIYWDSTQEPLPDPKVAMAGMVEKGVCVWGITEGNTSVSVEILDDARRKSVIEVPIEVYAPSQQSTPKAAYSGILEWLTGVDKDTCYSLDSGISWQKCEGYYVELSDAAVGTANGIWVQKPSGNGLEASEIQKITLTKAELPTGVGKTDETEYGMNDGALTGLGAKMQFRGPGYVEWTTPKGSTVTGLTPGDYQVRMKGDVNKLPSGPLTLTINSGYSPVPSAPTGEINIAANSWKDFLHELTLGQFFKETQEVTINSSGLGSVTVEYFTTDEDLSEEEVKAKNDGWQPYHGSFHLEPDADVVVYARITDSINTLYLRSDRIVLDRTAPTFSLEDQKTYEGIQNLRVSDNYALASVKLDGEEQLPKDFTDRKKTLLLNTNGVHTITAQDKAGNQASITVTITNITAEQVEAPSFNPAGGTYDSPQNVEITCAAKDAEIHYTTDGTMPAADSAKYTGAVKVAENTTLRAIAVKPGMVDSEVAEAVYIIQNTPVHTHNWSEEWTNDKDSHWHECTVKDCPIIENEKKAGYMTHIASDWITTKQPTETEAGSKKKECTICRLELDTKVIPATGSAHTHELMQIAKKPATCIEPGHTEYYYCDGCGKYFSDSEGISEIEQSTTIIEATRDHTGAGDWQHDGENHWKQCSVCNQAVDQSVHSGGTADCHQKAVCEVCGAEYGSLSPDNHDGVTEVRNQKDATETEEGYTGDTYCLSCDTKISTGTPIPATGHTHEFGGGWQSDSTHHWQLCTAGDGEIGSKGAHTASGWIDDKKLSENELSKQYKECTVCGYTMAISIILKTEVIKDFTVTTDGLWKFYGAFQDLKALRLNGVEMGIIAQSDTLANLTYPGYGDIAGIAAAGSVEVTLYADFLKTLPAGKYTLEAEFASGETTSTGSSEFTVANNEKPMPSPDPNEPAPSPDPSKPMSKPGSPKQITSKQTVQSDIPTTGDTCQLWPWILMMLTALTGGTVLICKKRKRTEQQK